MSGGQFGCDGIECSWCGYKIEEQTDTASYTACLAAHNRICAAVEFTKLISRMLLSHGAKYLEGNQQCLNGLIDTAKQIMGQEANDDQTDD
jgi:hypothetical protein